MAMLAGVTLKAAGVLPQAGSKARELQDPESHHIKKLGSSLFRVGNLKISILNSLLTALQ
jgi:hypothetical protein